MDECFKTFLNGLGFVASTPDQQKEALPPFVNIADEVALAFDDVFTLSQQLYENKILSAKIMASLQELDRLFDAMLTEKKDWTFGCMLHSEKWEATRNIAKDILSELGIKEEPKAKNICGYYTWIKS